MSSMRWSGISWERKSASLYEPMLPLLHVHEPSMSAVARLDLTSHLRSIAGTIVEHEEAEKIFLANALGENGVLNAWAKPQAITPDGLQGLVGCPADQPTLARRAAPECASVNGHSRPPSVITSQTSGRSADTRRSRASRSA